MGKINARNGGRPYYSEMSTLCDVVYRSARARPSQARRRCIFPDKMGLSHFFRPSRRATARKSTILMPGGAPSTTSRRDVGPHQRLFRSAIGGRKQCARQLDESRLNRPSIYDGHTTDNGRLLFVHTYPPVRSKLWNDISKLGV